MGLTAWARGRFWEPNEDPYVHTATNELLLSIDSNLLGQHSNVGARDTALGGLSAGDRPGAVAWVADRQGWCGWTGSEWRWLTVEKDLFNYSQSSGGTGANSSDAVIVNGSESDDIDLPPGNRRIRIQAGGDLIPSASVKIASDAGARLYPLIRPTNVIPFRMQQRLDAPGAAASMAPFRRTVYCERTLTLSGTLSFELQLLKEQGAPDTGYVDVERPFLRVTDLGPA